MTQKNLFSEESKLKKQIIRLCLKFVEENHCTLSLAVNIDSETEINGDLTQSTMIKSVAIESKMNKRTAF